MTQINNQKYVNKIRNVKCDICGKELITGYKLEDLQNGLMSDELILSQAAYHIRKHYREEIPADINKFMIIEKNEEQKQPTKEQQPQVKPKNNNNSSKKVKQPQPAKEKEERVKCKLCGETSVAFNLESSMAEHLENYHRFFEKVNLATEWFFVSVSAEEKETSA